ncbi:MAG: hypothetical protein ABIO04_04810 [Ferruginibacter sp.]
MYLKRLIIIIIISISIALLSGILLDHIYKKRWSTLFFDKTETLIASKTNYDIIFLGNSRVHFGINPYYIDSITKLHSYNFANGGSDAEDILLTSRVYLQYHAAPKVVVISLDMGALKPNESLKTCYHYLFYLQNDTIKKYMNKAGHLTTLMKLLPFIKYSFFDEYNRTSLFLKGKPYPQFDHNIYNGFLNIHRQNNIEAGAMYAIRDNEEVLSTEAITYLINAVEAFRLNGSIVIFVTPPERKKSVYRDTRFRQTTDSVFNSIVKQFRLPNFHFENDSMYTNEYFVDDIHLNEPGSRIYSLQLGDSIRNQLHE